MQSSWTQKTTKKIQCTLSEHYELRWACSVCVCAECRLSLVWRPVLTEQNCRTQCECRKVQMYACVLWSCMTCDAGKFLIFWLLLFRLLFRTFDKFTIYEIVSAQSFPFVWFGSARIVTIVQWPFIGAVSITSSFRKIVQYAWESVCMLCYAFFFLFSSLYYNVWGHPFILDGKVRGAIRMSAALCEMVLSVKKALFTISTFQNHSQLGEDCDSALAS